MFLNANTIFPFAFGPENISSREVIFNDLDTLEVNFDITVEDTPECSAIAVIFNYLRHFEELKFDLYNEGDPLDIVVELKTIQNGILTKIKEQNISANKTICLNNIKEDIKEVVFCCWRSNNKNKKGKVRIKAFY